MPLAILALISTTLLVWFYQHFINDKENQDLYFYYNLGLTELKLYSFTFLINLIILISINTYLK